MDSTISLTLLAKDLASGNIQKVAVGLDDMQKKGSLAGTVLKSAGVLGAAGLGAITLAAGQAQTAQGKFMAATGASREESKTFISAMDGLAGSVGAVGKSFEEITQVGTTVAQQFGTTGQDTTDLTEKILELAKVSGGDATAQANALGDTLAGMGLDASAAGAVMDNLVASNQQFGTSIDDSIAALDDMTPALQTLGLTLEDGQALLNTFEQANVDAGTAAGDLTKAIQNLKPGQDIDNLIAQVGAIEDPILRAQEATKLFGKAAGPDMAKVIKPGMTSLEDLETQASNVGGSLDGAADAMLTDADKIINGPLQKLMAGAREVGQDFGPAIMGISSLASLAAPFAKGGIELIKKVGTAILPAAAAAGVAEGEAQAAGATSASILGSWLAKFGAMTPAKIAAAEAAGLAEGTAEGGAAATGIVGALKTGAKFIAPVAVAAIAAEFYPAMAAKSGELGAAFWQVITGAVGGSADREKGFLYGTILDTIGDAAVGAFDAFANSDVGRFTFIGPDGILYVRPGEAEEFGGTIGTGIGTGAAAGLESTPLITAAGFNSWQHEASAAGTDTAASFRESSVPGFKDAAHDAVVGFTGTAADDARESTTFSGIANLWARDLADSEAWASSARAIGSNFADALRSNKETVGGAMDDLMFVINHPLKAEKEIARIEGDLTSTKLRDALASKNPAIKAQAEQTKAFLISQWELLSGRAYPLGNAASTDLKDGLNNGYPGAKSDASNFVSQMNAIFGDLKTNYHIKTVVTHNVGGNRNDPTNQKALGGPVAPNSMYEVTEGGRPELLGVGGQTFLLMGGQSGYVTPIGGPGGAAGGFSGAGDGGVNVNLSFHSMFPPYSGAQMADAVRQVIPELTREMRRQRLLPQGGF